MGGICARAIYVYPLTFFCLNYWRYTLNCLRDAQLFIVCPFDWRFVAISLSNDETIIKLQSHPSWVHPVTPFFPGHYRCTCQLSLNERLAFFAITVKRCCLKMKLMAKCGCCIPKECPSRKCIFPRLIVDGQTSQSSTIERLAFFCRIEVTECRASSPYRTAYSHCPLRRRISIYWVVNAGPRMASNCG